MTRQSAPEGALRTAGQDVAADSTRLVRFVDERAFERRFGRARWARFSPYARRLRRAA